MASKVNVNLGGRPFRDEDLKVGVNREVVPTLRSLLDAYNNSQGGPVTVSEDTTATAEYQTYLVDASAGAVTITLPSANLWPMQLYIKKTDSSGNAVTVLADGYDLIEGSASVSFSGQYDYETLISDTESEWWRFY